MAHKCLPESHIPLTSSSPVGPSKCIQAITYLVSTPDRPWNPSTKEQAQQIESTDKSLVRKTGLQRWSYPQLHY